MVALNEIQELSRRIAEQFRPDKIILFGSHAYGTPKEYSDVDLLVIMPFAGNSFDQATTILERVRPGYYVDVIVRSPDDAARRYQEFDPLIRDAFDRGMVIYVRRG
jgi:predicted nucleotidyltransferase